MYVSLPLSSWTLARQCWKRPWETLEMRSNRLRFVDERNSGSESNLKKRKKLLLVSNTAPCNGSWYLLYGLNVMKMFGCVSGMKSGFWKVDAGRSQQASIFAWVFLRSGNDASSCKQCKPLNSEFEFWWDRRRSRTGTLEMLYVWALRMTLAAQSAGEIINEEHEHGDFAHRSSQN